MLELNDAYGTTRPTDEPIRAALDSIKENKEAIRVGVLRDYVGTVATLGSGEVEDASAMLAQLYNGRDPRDFGSVNINDLLAR